MTIDMLGGMMGATQAVAAVVAAAKSRSIPASSMVSISNRPTPVMSATAEPEQPARNTDVSTFT